MKAHLFAISLWGIAARAAGNHDVAAGLEARQAFPSNAAVSVCYTYTSTYLTLVTPTTSGGTPTPTPPAFSSVILGIEPLAVAKRDLEKRAGLGGFLTNDPANPNVLNCAQATIFQLQIGGGLFLDNGLSLFTTSVAAFQEFRSTGPAPAGGLTTSFSGQDGSILTWTNTAFFGGAASFCQVPTTGQVYATFKGQTNVPAGCITIQLRIYTTSRCNNGVINGGSSSSLPGVSTTQTQPVSQPPASSPTPTNVSPSTSTIPDVFPGSSTIPNVISGSSTIPGVLPSSATIPEVLPSSTTIPNIFPTSSSTISVFPGSSTVPDIFPRSSSTITDMFPTRSSTIPDVFPTSSAASTTHLTSSTVTATVSRSIIDNGSSSTPTTTPTPSSASQITITSTSTKTTYVVTGASSASSTSTPSFTPCAFSTSGSLITNGGFENPSNDPFSYAPLGVLPPRTKKRHAGSTLEKRVLDNIAKSSIAIVSSAAAPRTYGGLCAYVLEISYPGGNVLSTDVYGTILPFTTLGQAYSISFDVLACGASGYVVVDINDFSSGQIPNQNCSPGGPAAWKTIRGTFVALGTLDTLYIRVTGDVDQSQDYFDNFVITVTTRTSTSSSALARSSVSP